MKHLEQITDNKNLVIGKYYVYTTRDNNEPIFCIHQEGKFQNEQHKRDYLESQGAIYILKDLYSDKITDVHQVDYLEERYSIYPITKENLGFILDLHKFRTNKKAQKKLINTFYENRI